jgi:ATP-dependent Clp protease ATP-binding subunit ClpC
MQGLKLAFRPEFINRIDQIVVFQALGKEELYQIVDLLLAQVRTRLSEQKMDLEISAEVKDFLLSEGFDAEYGARPLRRAIQNYVDDALADALLDGTIQTGQMVRLVLAGDHLAVEPVTVTQAA